MENSGLSVLYYIFKDAEMWVKSVTFNSFTLLLLKTMVFWFISVIFFILSVVNQSWTWIYNSKHQMVLPVSLEKSSPANMSHSLCDPLPRSICFQLLVDSLDIYLQIPANLNWYFLSFQSYVLAFCYKDEVWLSFTALPTSPTVYQYSILALSPSFYHPCVFVMVLSIFDLLHYGLVFLYV